MHGAHEGNSDSDTEPRLPSIVTLGSEFSNGDSSGRSDEKSAEGPRLHPSKRVTQAPPPPSLHRRVALVVESKITGKKKAPPPPPTGGSLLTSVGMRQKFSTLPKGFANSTMAASTTSNGTGASAPPSPRHSRLSDPKPPPPPLAVATSFPPVVPRRGHQRAQSHTNAQVLVLEKKFDPLSRTSSDEVRPLVMKTAAAPTPIPFQTPEYSTFLPVSTMPEDIQQLGSVPISWAFHKRLGHGSTSDVFLVTDRTRYCDLAVKAFAIGDDDHNRMIRQEMDLMLRCKHPNIVNVGPNSCFQSHYGEFFMAMEMCDAGPLSETLSRARESPTEAIAAYILECLLLALNFLHSKKIVHRDVKAANILLTTDGKVKLSDFGVAVQVSRPPARPRRSSDTYMKSYLSPTSAAAPADTADARSASLLLPPATPTASYMSLPVTPIAASQIMSTLPTSPKFENRHPSNNSISVIPVSPSSRRTASKSPSPNTQHERRNFVFSPVVRSSPHGSPTNSPSHSRRPSPEPPSKKCACGSALSSPDAPMCDICKTRLSSSELTVPTNPPSLTPSVSDNPPVVKRLKSSSGNSALAASSRLNKSRAASMTLPSKKKLTKRSSNNNIVIPVNLPQLDSEEDAFNTASDLSAFEDDSKTTTPTPTPVTPITPSAPLTPVKSTVITPITTVTPTTSTLTTTPPKPTVSSQSTTPTTISTTTVLQTPPRRTLSPSPEQKEYPHTLLGPPRRSFTPTPEQQVAGSASSSLSLSTVGMAVGRSQTLRKHHKSTPSYDMNTGVQAGSLPWMSPEALKFFAPGFPVDVWAVGITAIHLARLKVPYAGLVRTEITRRILVSQIVPSLDNDDGILDPQSKWSPEFHDFVSQCLQLEVSKRWTVKQLLNHPFIRKNHTGQCPPDFSYWIAYGRFDKKLKGGQPEQLAATTAAHRLSLAAKRSASGLKNPPVVVTVPPEEPTATPRHRRHRQSGFKSLLSVSNLAENALQSLAQLARDIAEADNDEGPKPPLEASDGEDGRATDAGQDAKTDPSESMPAPDDGPFKPKLTLPVDEQPPFKPKLSLDAGRFGTLKPHKPKLSIDNLPNPLLVRSVSDSIVRPELLVRSPSEETERVEFSDHEHPTGSPVLDPLSDPPTDDCSERRRSRPSEEKPRTRLSDDSSKPLKSRLSDDNGTFKPGKTRASSDDNGPFKPKLTLSNIRSDDGPFKPKLSLGLTTDTENGPFKPKLTLGDSFDGSAKPKLSLDNESGPTKPKLSLIDVETGAKHRKLGRIVEVTAEISEMTILDSDDDNSDEYHFEELTMSASPSNNSNKGLPCLEGTFDMNQTFTADKDGFTAHGFRIGAEGIVQEEAPETDGPATMDLPLRKEDLVHLRVIGRGQNGTVSKTFHLRSLCYLALKTMNAFDKSSRHQLLRELRAFAAFNSPFILRFMGAFYDEGEIVLALEYMERGSLQHLVKKRGPMPAHYLKTVANSMASGLGVLHSARKVHRDIKPDNALMDKNGFVKLADFGLLKDLSEEEKCSTFLGTMLYLSPERATSQQYSYPADIWSLGVTMIFCATGAVPLPPNDYWGLVKQITTFSEQLFPASLCETTNNISPHCRDFILECLAVDPAKRGTAISLLTHPYLIDLKGLSPKNNTEEHDEPSTSVTKAHATAADAKRAAEEATKALAEQQKRADNAADACRALEAPLKSANKELDLAQWAINDLEGPHFDEKAVSEGASEDEALRKARANHGLALNKVAKARAPFKSAKKAALAEAEKATALGVIATQKNREAEEAWRTLEELKAAAGADIAKWNFRNTPDGSERVDPDLDTVIDIFVEYYYRDPADGSYQNATEMHDLASVNLAEQLGLDPSLVSGAVYATLMDKKTGTMRDKSKKQLSGSNNQKGSLAGRRKPTSVAPPRKNSTGLKLMKRRTAVTEIKAVEIATLTSVRRVPPPPIYKK